jgi:ABC-type phosphate transport system permease subunit
MYAENPSPAFPLFELRACSHKLESRTAWEARRNSAILGTLRAYMSTAVVKILAHILPIPLTYLSEAFVCTALKSQHPFDRR